MIFNNCPEMKGLSNFDDVTPPSDLCLKVQGWAVTAESSVFQIFIFPPSLSLPAQHSLPPGHKYRLPLL